MVKIVKKCIGAYKSFVLYTRCKHAIKEAERRKAITGLKQLVIMYYGRPVVISKRYLKVKIREGYFDKGFTPEKAEALAIYKTL